MTPSMKFLFFLIVGHSSIVSSWSHPLMFLDIWKGTQVDEVKPIEPAISSTPQDLNTMSWQYTENDHPKPSKKMSEETLHSSIRSKSLDRYEVSPLSRTGESSEKIEVTFTKQKAHPFLKYFFYTPSKKGDTKIFIEKEIVDHSIVNEDNVVNPKAWINQNSSAPNTSSILTNEERSESVAEEKLNLRPIIGILAGDLSKTIIDEFGLNYTSIISASYVKFVESGGARVVPVLIDQNSTYYDLLFSSLNGYLLPGGAIPVNNSTGYGRIGRKIYEFVTKNRPKVGKPPPIFGACLGLELLIYLDQMQYHRVYCNASDLPTSLKFLEGYSSSRLFNGLPRTLRKSLERENITANFHHWCTTLEDFNSAGLNRSYRALTSSYDRNGVEFVSTIEHRIHPIWATQWHPEKAAFEWTTEKNHKDIPHSSRAIEAMQYMANFFVNQARKNLNKFPTEELEQSHLTYNYQPLYTGNRTIFEQLYLF